MESRVRNSSPEDQSCRTGLKRKILPQREDSSNNYEYRDGVRMGSKLRSKNTVRCILMATGITRVKGMKKAS